MSLSVAIVLGIAVGTLCGYLDINPLYAIIPAYIAHTFQTLFSGGKEQ
jgi:hypothetical protein